MDDPVTASGLVARRTIQAAGSKLMFGMSGGVVRAWAMSDVQVSVTILVLIGKLHFYRL